MSKSLRPLLFAAVASLALCQFSGQAQAQFVPFNPYNNYYNGMGMGWGWGGDPFGGNLNAASNMVQAQGNLLIQTQQAYKMQEEVKRSKYDTRRKQFDEWMYERANTPTREQEREMVRLEQLQRSKANPPLTEIWSGKALNDLMTDIQVNGGGSSFNSTFMQTPLSPDLVKHINVTTGNTNGSVGILRDGGKLSWTYVLADTPYDKERDELDKLVPELAKQASTGKIDFKTLRKAESDLKDLQGKLKANIAKVPSYQWIDAKRFLTEIQDAFDVLKKPEATKYFDNNLVAKGQNVADLVGYMTEKGLKFAAATPGSESYYTALHRALSSYDIQVTQMTARPSPPQPMPPRPSPNK